MDVTEMDIWLHGRVKGKSITTCTAEQKKRKKEENGTNVEIKPEQARRETIYRK
jgi:hypothetical protein